MTNRQILEQAIQKAIDGGWSPTMDTSRLWSVDDILHWYSLHRFSHRAWNDDNYLKFIFSHDFAKALWGDFLCCLTCGSSQVAKGKRKSDSDSCIGCLEPNLAPSWQLYLQQMVIADDPIKYLGENI